MSYLVTTSEFRWMDLDILSRKAVNGGSSPLLDIICNFVALLEGSVLELVGAQKAAVTTVIGTMEMQMSMHDTSLARTWI